MLTFSNDCAYSVTSTLIVGRGGIGFVNVINNSRFNVDNEYDICAFAEIGFCFLRIVVIIEDDCYR